MISRSIPLAVLLASFVLLVVGVANRPAEANDEKLPNIVLVMADDLGWGDTGFNGNQIIKTPHLDEMAAAGLRFERFYSAAPVCSPTRGSCLTGRHPYRYGVFFANTGHMLPEEMTLPELLKTRGYMTGHFGKWHLGTLTKTDKDANRGGPRGVEHYSIPSDNGFDVYFSSESKVPTWDPMVRPRGEKGGTWWDPATDTSQHAPYGTAYWSNHGRVVDNLAGDDSRVIMDRALPFIEEASRAGQPFFAVVWFHAPHLPVVAGPKYTAMYSEHDKYKQHYYGCITALDEQVGRLRRTLREVGVADNTMVWFCSDNGPEGNDSAPGSSGGLRGRKRSLFEGGVRVPALVEWPGKVKPGSVSSMPAVTSDYLPTLLELVGVERADERPLDGVSLLALLEGGMDERPRPIGFQSRDQIALNDNRFKLVSQDEGKTFMLFDIPADRGEQNDLSAEHPDVVRRMAADLEAWRASCRDSLEGRDYP